MPSASEIKAQLANARAERQREEERIMKELEEAEKREEEEKRLAAEAKRAAEGAERRAAEEKWLADERAAEEKRVAEERAVEERWNAEERRAAEAAMVVDEPQGSEKIVVKRKADKGKGKEKEEEVFESAITEVQIFFKTLNRWPVAGLSEWLREFILWFRDPTYGVYESVTRIKFFFYRRTSWILSLTDSSGAQYTIIFVIS